MTPKTKALVWLLADTTLTTCAALVSIPPGCINKEQWVTDNITQYYKEQQINHFNLRLGATKNLTAVPQL